LPVSPRLTGTTFGETAAVELIEGRYISRAVALADLNGDGSIDLIDGVKGFSGVQLNNGSGVFQSRSYTSTKFGNTRAIDVGDIDRDGDIDFVEANYGDQNRLYLNDGTGATFAIQNVSADEANTSDIAFADINGDGLLDVVVANVSFQASKANRVYINPGDPLTPFGWVGTGGLGVGIGPGMSSRGVAVGDLDKDGDLDIVFLNDNTADPDDNFRDQRNHVLMNRLAQGSPIRFVQSEIEIPGSNDVAFSLKGALGDLDADGFLDLVVCNRGDVQGSQIYLNNGDATVNANPFTTAAIDFSSGPTPDDRIPCQSVSIADADNDGDLDIFLTSGSVNFRNRVYFNDGTGSNFSWVDVGPVGQAPLILSDPNDPGVDSPAGVVGDVDKDGDIDWVIGNQFSNSVGLENNLFRNNGKDDTVLVRQLSAKATSLQIDNSGAVSVKLAPSPATSMVGPEFLNEITYWISGNAAQNWSSVQPDGRPVAIGVGTDVRWRVELQSASPATAAGLALLQLDIVENVTGPFVVTPIGSAEVNEDDGVTGLPIVSDFEDPDGDTIYHSVTGLPGGTGLAIDPLSGEISGTPTNDDAVASPVTVTVFATDGALTATDTFILTVNNENDPPVILSTPPVGNAVQDALYSYMLEASDPDPNETELLRFSITTAPAWLSLVDNEDGTATLSGTPLNSDVTGDNAVVIAASDPDGLSDTQSFLINVDNVNDQPVFTSNPPAGDANIDELYTYSISAADPDVGETAMLTFSAPTMPGWLSVSDNGDGTALLAGIPVVSDVTGDNSVVLEVTDPAGLSSSQSFVVNVRSTNVAPEFVSTPLTSATELSEFRYSIRAIDPNGDSVSITASTLPGWLTLTDRGGGFAILQGTPMGPDVGDHRIVLRAAEDAPAEGLVTSQQFLITVTATSNGPTITVNGDAEMNIFLDWNFNDPGATATDVEDGDISDQIVSEGTVSTSSPGIYTITYTVADTAGNRAQAQRIVRVVAPPSQTSGGGADSPAWLLLLSIFACLGRYLRRSIVPFRDR
jgi:hypothetical protein